MSEEIGFIRAALTDIRAGQVRMEGKLDSTITTQSEQGERIAKIEGAQTHSKFTIPMIVSAIVAFVVLGLGIIIGT